MPYGLMFENGISVVADTLDINDDDESIEFEGSFALNDIDAANLPNLVVQKLHSGEDVEITIIFNENDDEGITIRGLFQFDFSYGRNNVRFRGRIGPALQSMNITFSN